MSLLISLALNYFLGLKKWCDRAFAKQHLSYLRPPSWYKEKSEDLENWFLPG